MLARAGESFAAQPLLMVLLDYYGNEIPVHTNATYFVELRNTNKYSRSTILGNVRAVFAALKCVCLSIVWVLVVLLCRSSAMRRRFRSSRFGVASFDMWVALLLSMRLAGPR